MSLLTTINGMVRVFGSSAAVTRLENAQMIVANTELASLSLKNGDALQASDNQKAIVIAGSTTSESVTIPVKVPVDGGASGNDGLVIAEWC